MLILETTCSIDCYNSLDASDQSWLASRYVLRACNLKMSYFKNVPSHLLCWCNLIGCACVARGNHLLLYEEAYGPNWSRERERERERGRGREGGREREGERERERERESERASESMGMFWPQLYGSLSNGLVFVCQC